MPWGGSRAAHEPWQARGGGGRALSVGPRAPGEGSHIDSREAYKRLARVVRQEWGVEGRRFRLHIRPE